MGALIDFGEQTRLWGKDLWKMLKQTGWSITRRPFGGQPIPRLTTQPPRR